MPTYAFSTSVSDPQGLTDGRKRKAQRQYDLAEVVSMVTLTLARVKEEKLLVPFDENTWDTVLERIHQFPEFSDSSPKSVAFAEAQPFLAHLFTGSGLRIEVPDAEDVIPADRYTAVADELRQNPLWETMVDHVVVGNETACRTAIDLVALMALRLAQQKLVSEPFLDKEIVKRHSLSSSQRATQLSKSHIIMQQEVDIPDQPVSPTLMLHGVLDYLFLMTPSDVVRGMPHRHRFLTGSDMPPRVQLSDRVSQAVLLILEARTSMTLEASKNTAQIAAQGAAMCILTKRAMVNTLSDGTRWKFHRISKTLSQAPSPQLTQNTSGKAFNIEATRTLNIFDGNDLAIVLRLLSLAMLEPADKFGELAETWDLGIQQS